jgi:long-subunit fatty acid transport protein
LYQNAAPRSFKGGVPDMNLKALLVTVYLVILSVTSIGAQEPFFYDGTRALSMGKAFTGMADDENALFYNPAGLTQIKGHTISLSGYIQQYSWDVNTIYLEPHSANFTDRGFTASYVQHRFGISYSLTGKGLWDHLEFGRWTFGTPTTTVRPVNYERYLTACYAHEINSWISLGGTVKYLHFSYHYDSEYIDNTDGVTFDIGLLVEPTERLSLGLNLQNIISSKIDYAVYNDYTTVAYLSELPVNLTAGISWLPVDALTITADLKNIIQDDVKSTVNDYMLEFKRSYHLGIEWRSTFGLALRGGYYRCERPIDQVYPVTPFGTPGSDYYEYRTYTNFALGAGYMYQGFSLDLGVKLDDRSLKMDESETSELRDNTAMGSASVSYTF